MAQLSTGEPFLQLRQWIKSSHSHPDGSLLHRFVRLRNQKAHDERRAQLTFIADVTKHAEDLYTALAQLHPAVPDLVLGSDGTLLRHSREMTILCSPKMTHHHRQLGGVLLARWP